MANKEHLTILKQGVEAWNKWREQNWKIKCDLNNAKLSGVNLSYANVSGAELSGIGLSGARLAHANFSEANLSRADLEGTDLTRADLEGTDLSYANLREANLIKANLSGADLSGADLSGAFFIRANLLKANLSGADLSGASFIEANFSGANLSRADLREADLSYANFSKANLSKVDLSGMNLSYVNLSGADLSGVDLSGAHLNYANLSRADLSGAHLIKADCRKANFHKANLIKANLMMAQALATNFSHARLTAACIQDWNINAQTQLQEVTCDYIYLQYNLTKDEFRDRRPYNLNRAFAPGEFTERFQKVLDTVDLFFTDGIDWRAFLTSFQDLQAQYGDDNLMVQGFDRKGNGLEVRLAVSSDLDKAEIEHNAFQKYKAQLHLVVAQYRAELRAKDKEIESYCRESANMMEITKLLASKPITIEAKAEAVADNQSKNTNYNLQNSKFGGGFAAEGGIQIGGQLIDASSQQKLAEAAQDIQALLDQLSTTYPTTTSAQQMVVATKAVEEIEKNPALMQRLIAVLKAGGTEALKELVDHPAVNILLAAIEGWQNPE